MLALLDVRLDRKYHVPNVEIVKSVSELVYPENRNWKYLANSLN